ncbi:MAG: hypothetical protein J5988_09240, partial [Eubacterium sp.]|nr:hypothetical protein [Eubacterium sp.]
MLSYKAEKCRITLPDGTYDVRAILGPSYISLGSSGQYQVTKNIVNYKVSENNQNLNIKMPVYKVSLSATDRNMNLSGMVWYDEENNTIGLGSS